MYETLEDMREQGYNVDKLTPTHSKNDIVWDSENNQFVLVYENGDMYTGTTVDPTADKSKMWKVYTEMPESSEYSIYLAGTGAIETANVNGVGFDAGNKEITTVNYSNTGSAKDVVIRTNGGNLIVDASNDTVNHYGNAGQVKVNAVANHSYHEYGEVTAVVVKTGRVVVEEKSKVAMVIADTTETSSVKVEVSSEETAVYAPEGVEIVSPNSSVKSSGVLTSEEINNATTGENDFSGGFGTENRPYLISTKDDAMNIENNKGYFKLINNIVVNDEIYMSKKTYVIDLNGFSIRLEYPENVKPNNGSVLYIGGKSGKLTINDSSEAQTGAVYGSNKSYENKVTSAVRVGNYGKLTINGGHFYGKSEGTSCIFVYTSATSSAKATVTINGGIFETATPLNGIYYVLNHQDSISAGCTMTVNGGRFKNYNPEVTQVDSVNTKTGKISLGSGCSTTEEVDASGNTWYVVSKVQTEETNA